MTILDLIETTKKWFEKYSSLELLEWIQATSIHPSNQKYQVRFELLISILLSIEKDKFQEDSLKYKEFKKFIEQFKEKTDNKFIEDYYIFDQLKIIPYFFEGHKFSFFYGIVEILIKFFIIKFIRERYRIYSFR